MSEIELIAGELTPYDNTVNVEMKNDEIWFLKSFIKRYKPKKIVEIGISAGGNTVNLLQWKDKDAQLFSIDIANEWYQDKTKLSGWMAEELNIKNNWKLYRGCDYLDVYKEIGNDIDFIIIDTVHFMPGELLTFLTALPQLKNGCIVILHDIHLNILRVSGDNFREGDIAAHCTGLLFGGVSSSKKWSLKSNSISNIGAFVVDDLTRNNIKDIFRILCSAWAIFPSELELTDYFNYIYDNYPIECYNLFKICFKAQANYFNVNINKNAHSARIDILNMNAPNNTIKLINPPEFIKVNFPSWFSTDKGKGAVIETNEKIVNLKFRCIKKGLLDITLRGPDVRDKLGNRVPNYVDFKSFKVNNEEIISENVTVWHDDPYIFKKKVNNGEIIELNFEWESHKSSEL